MKLTDESLAPHQVHLWHAFTPQQDEALNARQLSLLTPDERTRMARFHFERDRHRYLITRALVRSVLSRYAPIEPEAWTFEPGPHGRPYITNPHPLAQALRFNLSHTDGLVVLAVTTGREVGVDTESMARTAPLEVADRFFSKREAEALRALPASDQAHRFWELWTFKESYIKARGLGLSLPLSKFSFQLDDDAAQVDIGFEPGLDDSPARWRFWQLRPDANHLVALCLEACASAQPVEFQCKTVQPLHSLAPLAFELTRQPRP
jgi:4'-phosphopantetheinyl transferase